MAYTTVMTMMNILETKGYLKKEKQDRAYHYRPARPEQTVIASMVREFVGRVFDGAPSPCCCISPRMDSSTRMNAANCCG